MHLVDTSVWVDFLKGVSDPRVSLLEGLLEEGEAYLCEITFAEICFGAKDENQFRKYNQYFSALPFLALPPHWHQEAARLGNILRRKGRKPFIADLLIALTALAHKAILLTHDTDFRPYQDLFGLVLE